MKSFSFARLLAAAGLLLALIAVGSGVGPAHAASLAIAAPAGSGLAISPAKQIQYVQGNQTYIYHYKVFNGSTTATGQFVKFVATSDQGWQVAVSPAEAFVPTNTAVEIKVAVTVPPVAPSNGSLVKVGAFAADGSSTTAYLSLQLGSGPVVAP
jgi:hypothetical protein